MGNVYFQWKYLVLLENWQCLLSAFWDFHKTVHFAKGKPEVSKRGKSNIDSNLGIFSNIFQ